MNSPTAPSPAVRHAQVQRQTQETQVEVELLLDGSGRTEIQTGLPFLDHMIDALCRHAGFDCTLRCRGDLQIDDHHSAEDVAIVLGQALREALGEKRGIVRVGSAYAPLDEALARAVVDLSGRPWPAIACGFRREMLGTVATENLTHFLESFAISAAINLHVDVLRGRNDHHRAEAAFKATALALREAVARRDDDRAPSTKGVLA
jgi:imidazoleglycerol phosphate dehydratase HisB